MDSLKSNEKHGRTNCVKLRKLQIEMIDDEIKEIEAYEPAEKVSV